MSDAFEGGVFCAFRRDCKGSVGIIFGLAFLPMILLSGGGIDYANAARVKSNLSHTADSAALASARAAAVAYSAIAAACVGNPAGNNVANYQGSKCSDVSGSAKAVGQSAANLIIKSDYQAQKYAGSFNISISSPGNGQWSSTVSYAAPVQTFFLPIVKINSIAAGGTSSATVSYGADYYLNVYLLLDNSMSMGIGSTASDISRLEQLTGCAFGCHESSSAYQYYTVPKNNGVRFRIDDLRDASVALVSTAQGVVSGNVHNHLKMGAWTFDNSVKPLVATTSNLSSVSSAISALDLPTVDDGTRIDTALTWMQNNIVVGNGDGSSAAKPLEILFLVTDGVQDNIYTSSPFSFSGITTPSGVGLPWWGSLAGKPAPTSAIDQSWCSGLKSKGVTIAVVYTTYVPFTGTVQYDDLVGPFASGIPTGLQNCATSGYFFTASSPQDITRGMQSLFNKAIASSPLRLSQ